MKTRIQMDMPEVLQEHMGLETEITAVAVLTAEDFRAFILRNTLPEQARARLRFTEAITKTPTSAQITGYKALLLTTPSNPTGIAVCGGDHVYRAGIFPDAWGFLDSRIRQMADYICKYDSIPDRVENELKMSYSRLSSVFTTVAADNGVGELLAAELRKRNEISEVILYEDCIQINYALDYGHVPLNRPGDFLTIAHLIGCDLEDFHLLHADEEHDLATISELHANTLTEQGKRDWADVLNAKVERIYHGYYGLQADISGCEPERLRDFSFMLAGDVSVLDYARWVNEADAEAEAEDEAQGMTLQ